MYIQVLFIIVLHVHTEPPGAPTSLNNTTTSYNTLVLSWITPQFTGGHNIDIDNNTIDLVPSDQVELRYQIDWCAFLCILSCACERKMYCSGQFLQFTDLIVNTWYNVSVTATNYFLVSYKQLMVMQD